MQSKIELTTQYECPGTGRITITIGGRGYCPECGNSVQVWSGGITSHFVKRVPGKSDDAAKAGEEK